MVNLQKSKKVKTAPERDGLKKPCKGHGTASVSRTLAVTSFRPLWTDCLEFPDQGVTPLFTEVKTSTVCLSLSTKEYREQLEHDLRFLHLLLRSYADKLKIFSAVDTVTSALEERVLLYMRTVCPQGEINGIEAGQIKKIGMGRYRLVTQVL